MANRKYDTPKDRYRSHRTTARKRGIQFSITFEEWYKVWIDSGHWSDRGRGKGKYCMSRIGDKGPYAVGNVKIVPHNDNLCDGTGMLKSVRNLHGMLGKSHSEETKRKMSAAAKKRYPLWGILNIQPEWFLCLPM